MARTVTIALAGDVMLGRTVDTMMAAHGPLYPWGNMRPELTKPAALLINLECALTDHHEEWTDRSGRRKTFYFRADPAMASACLSAVDVTFASLANNHAGDFGVPGLLETVRTLDEAGIQHAGAGRRLHDASTPAWLDVEDLRLCVLAFSDHPEEWAASDTSPGINLLPPVGSEASVETMGRAIGQVRDESDIVILSLHWGPNMRATPTRAFQDFAHTAIDAGADVVYGHSAHVVQGVEVYRGRPILYDTGDFVDDYAVDEALRNDLSALFLLSITDSQMERVELVPVKINMCQVNHASRPARDWFAERFMHLSKPFGTHVVDDGDRLRIDIDPVTSS